MKTLKRTEYKTGIEGMTCVIFTLYGGIFDCVLTCTGRDKDSAVELFREYLESIEFKFDEDVPYDVNVIDILGTTTVSLTTFVKELKNG